MHFKRLFLVGLGLFLLGGCASQPSEPVATTIDSARGVQRVTITVNHGYDPDVILAQPGLPIELVFKRREETDSCAQDLEIPSAKIKQTLPNRQNTTITLPPASAGTEIPFRCAMDMMRGKILVNSPR